VRRLRVALDGRPLQSEPLGGVGRYMLGVIPALADEAELFVLLDARRRDPPPALDARAHRVRLPAPRGVPGLGWLELAVAPWLRRFGGVFHATFNTLPLTRADRSVLTLHDLAPQRHPSDFRPATRAGWRLYVRASVRRAAAITTVSEFTRREIVEHFATDPARVRVAYPFADPLFAPERAADAGALAARLGIEPPYIVAVGGAPRRGLAVAIEAWRRAARMTATPTSLVVVGEPAMASDGRLVSLGFPHDEAWATLLAGARALCYPTRYEGFGLPALEAAASGTPVVCARVASLPEVLGDAGCWAQAPTVEAIADALGRVLSDAEWRRQQRELGLRRARCAPTSEDCARVLLEAYADAAR